MNPGPPKDQPTSTPSPRRPLVAVIGDARLDEDTQQYQMAERLGYALINCRYRLVTGGRGGVMEAASRGARRSPKHQDGDIIAILPGNDACDANQYADICIATGLDIARNCLIANSDAIIAIGGGSGTLSEIAMAWAKGRLILGYRGEGWSGMVADQRIDGRIRYPDIPDDRVYGVSTEEEALHYLKLIPHYNQRSAGVR
ncbi:TIGR00725 family protein [Methanocalculus sp.]|uniref:TIGR00725 family protein n=1 Tax=Methanocalculus sp. TaxID=2004547 RepID=UPI002715E9BD|nr:TIGR00725 family protein [Methanocalculus sp.]MDO8840786.1 TIGR00725 family protein [Methanocalculus sp.]